MKVIRNLNLRNKLFLALLTLLIPLLYFAANSLIIEKEKANSLEKTKHKLQEINRISQVLYNFQREMALSQGYTLTKGEIFSERIKEQRKVTDTSIENLHEGDLSTSKIKSVSHNITRLNHVRSEIDLLKILPSELESFYSEITSLLSEKLEFSSMDIDDSETKRQLDAYLSFLRSRYYLGQIRSLIISDNADYRFSLQALVNLSSKKSLFENAKAQYIKNFDPEIVGFYHEKTDHEAIKTAHSLIEAELNQSVSDKKNYNIAGLFNIFTDYTDILKEVDKFALGKIEKDLLLEKDIAKQKFLLFITFVTIMLVLAIWLSIYIINNLLYSVSLLKKAADKVALGDISVNIPQLSNDEIGSLANSFRILVNKNNQLALVSDEIGKGNYEVHIEITNKQDVLSNALNSMKENLKILSEKDRKRNWILTGASELNDLISGGRHLSSVANKILNFLCQYLQVEVGAFYVLNDHDKLELAAGFSFSPENEGLRIIDPHDSFIGQVLVDKKIHRLENISGPEFRIKTSLMDSDPAEVLIVPLIMQEQPVGILELASRKAFTDEKLEFLEHVDEKIAVVIITLLAEQKNAELLAETQSQAEELEMQQEELRQNNIELLAQQSRLQLSEEELKANHEELEGKNTELEEKASLLEEHFESISFKNKELEDAKQAIQSQIDELQRVGKYKAEFLANMSHELRTPLNSILILAKLISENRDHNLSAKQVEFAEVIHNSGNDLLKLINEILDLTKIESGKISLEIEEFSVHTLDPKPLFWEIAKDKNIAFDVQFSENLPSTITSDKFRIEQILKNLLSNAFKFTGEGGKVSLHVYPVSNSKDFMNIKLRESSKVIAFEVHDSGIGISEDDQLMIFNAFHQADSSTTRKFGGTGLGLSISKELAQILGGEIKVTSEKGKGSTFTLYIPEQIEKKRTVPVEVPTLDANRQNKEKVGTESILVEAEKLLDFDLEKTKTILIIEDDKGFSKILADFAKSKKIEPVTTHLGHRGIELAKQIRPNAILLDIQLPDISGWEVLDTLKQDNELKNIPVHIMSAYDLNPAKKGLAKENWLPKPVSLESLDKAFIRINSMNDNEVKKVLIVEDNQTESNAVKELLLAHDLLSDIANTGEEAFEKLQFENFDCIILDINLPKMGGYEVLEKLKENSLQKDIPVIIYSGKDFTEEEEFRLKKYVNAIVVKTEYSYRRLLDEVKLFLHKVQEKLPVNEALKLYRTDESLKNKKVLIVDDDSRNIYSLFNAFEAEEMDIVVANNGVEALKRLDENPDTHIILMDIMMPEMDGLECTRRIRKGATSSGVPIIALTAKAMKEDKAKCLEAGASDFVTKPVNVEKLLSLMRVWIHSNENSILT